MASDIAQRILVLVPAYNCGPQIGRVIDQFTPEVASKISELVIINNRSADNTETVAIEHLKTKPYLDARVLRNSENLGYGGSLKVGINYARANGFDWVIVLHGDDQGSISDIMPYVNAETFSDYDCVLGARFHPESRISGYSLFRRFGNLVFNIIYGFVLGCRVLDLGSGLNLYRVSIFDNDYYNAMPDDLTFDYCSLMAHVQFRRRIKFVPISWRELDQVSNVKMASQAGRSMKLLFTYAVNRADFFRRDQRYVKRTSYLSDAVYAQDAVKRGDF